MLNYKTILEARLGLWHIGCYPTGSGLSSIASAVLSARGRLAPRMFGWPMAQRGASGLLSAGAAGTTANGTPARQ